MKVNNMQVHTMHGHTMQGHTIQKHTADAHNVGTHHTEGILSRCTLHTVHTTQCTAQSFLLPVLGELWGDPTAQWWPRGLRSM